MPEECRNHLLLYLEKGEVFAIPDTAQFTFTVTKDSKTMAESQKQVSDVGNDLVAKLKAAGIDEKDIKTEGFNAYPKYENKAGIVCSPTYCPPSNPVITGYTVSHTYSVKVRNLEKASDIAKLLTDAGVSSLNGPDFTIADIDSVKDDARDKAIEDAKEQAQILARQLGVRLGDILDFQVIEMVTIQFLCMPELSQWMPEQRKLWRQTWSQDSQKSRFRFKLPTESETNIIFLRKHPRKGVFLLDFISENR